jgi:hypothetical protein
MLRLTSESSLSLTLERVPAGHLALRLSVDPRDGWMYGTPHAPPSIPTYIHGTHTDTSWCLVASTGSWTTSAAFLAGLVGDSRVRRPQDLGWLAYI